jgi:spore coat protein U-like protein
MLRPRAWGAPKGFEKMKTFVKAVIGLCAVGGIATAALAGSANANLGVSATITATCTISTSAVAFGGFAGTQVDATGSVTANCITGTAWTIGLGTGAGTGATTSTRKMTAGANTLGYGLYSDVAHSSNWGNAIGTDTIAGTGTGSSQTNTVYGSIPAGTVPAAGSYTDTVVATINF